MNEKEHNHAIILNFLLVRGQMLAPSYINPGKLPPEEPLKSILNLT